MTPQLSIVKTRFAKASLRPRCARHRSWGATCPFPNRSEGALTSQRIHGILTSQRIHWSSSRLRRADPSSTAAGISDCAPSSTSGADLNLRGSIEVAIMANTSCGPSTRYSSRIGRAYLGHRPDRIDAGRTGYRSVHAFPERFRLRPRQVEAVPSLFLSSYRMGAGGSTLFPGTVQRCSSLRGDPSHIEGSQCCCQCILR